MNIAILMFGQPRFFDITYKYIKEEFDIPGSTVKYFIHLWKDIGYTPEDSQRANYHRLTSRTISDSPGFQDIFRSLDIDKQYVKIEKYDKLQMLCNSWYEMNKFIKYNRPTPIPVPGILEYFLGQHYSMQKCFSMIEEYEKNLNMKFDIIIKARTDVIYKTMELYKNKELYLKDKIRHYTQIPLDYPTAKVGALRINKWVDDKWVGDSINEYKYELQTDHNIRLCHNDWTLVANRLAADFYFGRWFESYIITLGRDLFYKKDKARFQSQSDHTMQGNIAIYNNINLININRRDVKLVRSDKIKPDTSVDGKIVIPEDYDSTYEEKLKHCILRRFNKQS